MEFDESVTKEPNWATGELIVFDAFTSSIAPGLLVAMPTLPATSAMTELWILQGAVNFAMEPALAVPSLVTLVQGVAGGGDASFFRVVAVDGLAVALEIEEAGTGVVPVPELASLGSISLVR